MADSRTGTDVWIDEAHPRRTHDSGGVIKLLAGTGVRRRADLHMPLREIRGRTVLTGYLTMRAKGANAAQTITVKLNDEDWSTDAVTFEHQPATVSGVSGTFTCGALADGDSIQVPITTLLAQIAAGKKNRGFQVSTDATAVGTSNWRSFDSGFPAWEIHYDLSTAPTIPTDQRPNGGTGRSKPTLGWSNVDLGGETPEQAKLEVQIDPASNGVSPAWTSGVVTSTDPELDLTTTTYPGMGSGATTYWRVRTYDSVDNPSGWSSWSVMTYTPKPAFVFDSPTGGTIGDPTPEVIGHLASGTLSKYRLFVTKGGDRSAVLYDSGIRKPDGSGVSTSVPWKDPADEKRVIRRDDTNYQIGVRAFDSVARVPSAGDPPYTETWVTVTFNVGANAAPADFTVQQVIDGDPRLTFTFTRTEAPESVVISADGAIYAKVPLEDWTLSAGTYTWRDRGETHPYDPTTFTARCIDAGSRSPASAAVAVTVKVKGVWLIPDDDTIAPIRMRGRAVGSFTRTDRRARYQPENVDAPVDIVYGRNGFSGDWSGTIDRYQPTTGDIKAAVARLEQVFDSPRARPQLVWAMQSVPVSLSAASVVPADEFIDSSRIHNVSFHFDEVPQ